MSQAAGTRCAFCPPYDFEATATILRLWLRAVIALDDDHVAGRMRRAQRDGTLIFRRAVAGERSRIILELEHDVARTDRAFGILELAAADQEFRAVFAQRLGIRHHIGLVAFGVADVDVRDPIGLRHGSLPTSPPRRSPPRPSPRRPLDRSPR